MPKMKRYESFTAYAADQTPKNRAMIRALRTLVKRTTPELRESVKWGNGCWMKGDDPVAYVYSRPEYPEFGFFSGSGLKDPTGLLEGKGAYVRHVKMRTPADTKRTAV